MKNKLCLEKLHCKMAKKQAAEKHALLESKYIKLALVNSKFRFDVESFDLKFYLKYQLSSETSKFKFGSFSISYDEWGIGKVVVAFF